MNDLQEKMKEGPGIPAPMPSGARSEFVEVNGIRMHYVAAGSGAPIVCLHGWPQTSYSWRHVMERFGDRYQVIAPDLRGCGETDITDKGYDKKTIAEDICAFIDKVAGGRAVVVAHDMGGKAAYILAHLHPDRVEKLMLVDCQLPGRESPSALDGGAWHFGFHMAADFPEMLTKGREREYIGAQLRNWSRNKQAVTEQEISEYARHYARPGGMTAGFNYYRALREDAPFAATLAGRRLSMPVMALTGRHGVADLLANGLRDEATDLVSHVIEGCGHFVVEEAFEIFCQNLERFLGRGNSHSADI